jgi:hypothetical protein
MVENGDSQKLGNLVVFGGKENGGKTFITFRD